MSVEKLSITGVPSYSDSAAEQPRPLKVALAPIIWAVVIANLITALIGAVLYAINGALTH